MQSLFQRIVASRCGIVPTRVFGLAALGLSAFGLGSAAGCGTPLDACPDAFACPPMSLGETTGGTGGSGGMGGAGGTGGMGGEGSAGGSVSPGERCTSVADCQGPVDTVCGEALCEEGICQLAIKVGPLDSQVRGDCKRVDCDPSGKITTYDDPSDWYNDGLECTLDYCENSEARNAAVWDGFGCPETGAGTCFAGKCVECIQGVAEVCGDGFACDGQYCITVLCGQKKNGDKDIGIETGIDCGGECHPCFNPQGCKDPSDCVDGVCSGGTCALPTHSDGVKNDKETGVDCGCESCAPCADGLECLIGENCHSLVCWGGKCQAPKCTDGIKNGDEIDKDCGGPCSPCL